MNSAGAREADIRDRLRRHWEAAECSDVETEHSIDADDAILDASPGRAGLAEPIAPGTETPTQVPGR